MKPYLKYNTDFIFEQIKSYAVTEKGCKDWFKKYVEINNKFFYKNVDLVEIKESKLKKDVNLLIEAYSSDINNEIEDNSNI